MNRDAWMALLKGVVGGPEADPTAGYTQDAPYTDPVTGQVSSQPSFSNAAGKTIYDQPTGNLVKTPGFWDRVVNPSGSQMADQMNVGYKTAPALDAQQHSFAVAHANEGAKFALANQRSVDPSTISDADPELQRIRGAYGLSLTQRGIRPSELNADVTARTAYGLGQPVKEGQLQDVTTQNALDQSRKSAELGIPTRRSIAEGAGLTFDTKSNEAKTGRIGLENSVISEELKNRLAEQTGVEPLKIQLAASDASAALGRAPQQHEILAQLQKNELQRQKDVVPAETRVAASEAATKEKTLPDTGRAAVANAAQARVFAENLGMGQNAPVVHSYKPGGDTRSPVYPFSAAGSPNLIWTSPTAKAMAMTEQTGTSGGPKSVGGGLYFDPSANAIKGEVVKESAPAPTTVTRPAVAPITPEQPYKRDALGSMVVGQPSAKTDRINEIQNLLFSVDNKSNKVFISAEKYKQLQAELQQLTTSRR